MEINLSLDNDELLKDCVGEILTLEDQDGNPRQADEGEIKDFIGKLFVNRIHKEQRRKSNPSLTTIGVS